MTQRAILAAALLLAGLFPWFGCKGKNPEPPPRVPTVTVQHPVERQVTEYLDMTGSVAPSQTVSLVARVPGYLESVNFQDGSFVEKGRLLFVIEPEPYVEQLRLAEAQLERARAEYKRQLVMLKENATSAANVERWKSQRDQAAAQVELAKINLGYTRVTAPFSGRIGKRLVDPGNMVGTGGSTALATLDQFDPIYVDFSVNERDALRVRDTVRRLGHKAGNPDVPVPVFVGLLDEEGTPHRGTLDFVDNGVNTSTGTIQTRAIFQNSDRTLFPGAFARVRIPLGPPRPMLVVPERAVGSDQEGDFVLVVGKGDTVERRGVVRGPETPDGCAVSKGLTLKDRVVVSGLLRAQPGQKVVAVDGQAGGATAARSLP